MTLLRKEDIPAVIKAVLDHGSVMKAAKELGVDHQSIRYLATKSQKLKDTIEEVRKTKKRVSLREERRLAREWG